MMYNEDCLKGMERLADASVDLVLTDPPYGSTDCAFDKVIDIAGMWAGLKRVIKPNGAILIFSQLPYAVDVINGNRKMFRYEWIWEKSLGVGFLNAKKMPLRCHENILVFYKHLPTYNPQFTWGEPYKTAPRSFSMNYANQKPTVQQSDGRRYPRDVQLFSSFNNTLHPQQKPIGLLEYLIKTYSNEGELVLDIAAGSGSVGVACKRLNRRFIGFELDQHYYEVAVGRIEDNEKVK